MHIYTKTNTATTSLYTLSLHDALPISSRTTTDTICGRAANRSRTSALLHTTANRFETSFQRRGSPAGVQPSAPRSEEHTSELQSHHDLVCRLLLVKNNKNHK